MTRRKSKPTTPLRGALLQADVLSRYKSLLSAEDFSALLAELQQPLPQAIRINPLKVTPTKAIEDWSTRYSWQVKPVSYCPTGWQVLASPAPISQTIEHRLGNYYIQDAASMLPVELFHLDNLEQPLILDLAASPGGKTTHLVSRTNDRGLVIANDASLSRLPALRLVLQNWGAINTAVTSFPGERFGAWYPECFDRVLLDAPCSMENLRSTESHPMRPITVRERQGLSQRQIRLLTSAFQAVRPGGEVVYSTCTLAPEEDEAVLEMLLKRFPGSANITRLDDQLMINAPALMSSGENQYDPSIKNALRLWPHRYGTSGFFSALITKMSSLQTIQESPPLRSIEATGLVRLNTRQLGNLVERIYLSYGFDYKPVIEAQNLSMWKRGSLVYSIPETYITRFTGLPFQSLGLLTGEEMPDGFFPSHEFVARFGPQFRQGRYILSDEGLKSWFVGDDLEIDPPSMLAAGSAVAVFDQQSRLLGRGKIIKGRLKNLLPKRLF
jgi:16S rRNA (cytosine1407-C5)-methyltransferase